MKWKSTSLDFRWRLDRSTDKKTREAKMKLFIASVLLLAVGQCLGNCPRPEVPKFGKLRCSRPTKGVQMTCTFTCKPWTALVGESTITCDKNNQWDAKVPVCYPDYTKCNKKHKKRCPKISAKDMDRFAEQNSSATEDEIKALEFITNDFISRKMSRKPKIFKCLPEMCTVLCIRIPYKQLANVCVRCKKRKVLKCNRGGGLFLN